MNELAKIPRATRVILLVSASIPIMISAFPMLIKYLYYDTESLKTLQLWRLFTGIFISNFDVNLIFTLITRYQLLMFIDGQKLKVTSTNHEVELLFFVFTFSIPLGFSNLIEGLVSFSSNINMALIKYMCSLVDPEAMVNFFGFQINSLYFPYYYFIFDTLISRGSSKCYYGLVHAVIYIYVRRRFLEIPTWFISLYNRANGINLRNKRFKGVGRRVGG
jgi:hypothetical protein